jgi:spermidine synthase
VTTPGDLAPGVMTEYLTDDWGFFVRSAERLERFRSRYQDVEVHDSVPFGKLFRLDGYFMTSERDEFFYHENLVHMAALSHPRPARALIVGGGDGGAAEALFKHP